ncbi:hypothetical protein FPV67DRAFT_1648897 [Lyophyllum atratum]|nr:hypothetical protein FPV67DRAFT_1648897 [Lyophyllum atratum]
MSRTDTHRHAPTCTCTHHVMDGHAPTRTGMHSFGSAIATDIKVMALGFFKHVYRYFVPRRANQPPGNDSEPRLAPQLDGQHGAGQGTAISFPSLVPVYDHSGRILSYVYQGTPSLLPPLSFPPPPPLPPPAPLLQPPSLSPPPSLPRPSIPPPLPLTIRNKTQSHGRASVPSQAVQNKMPPNVSTDGTSQVTRTIAPAVSTSVESARPVLYTQLSDGRFVPAPNERPVKEHFDELNKTGNDIKWDGFPDGNFILDVSWAQWDLSDELMWHWAHRVGGGDRKGDENASEWENGKKSTRMCLGLIECDNQGCGMSIRPHTKPDQRDKQLQKACKCGAMLVYRKCDVKAVLWKWEDGVHYENKGFHDHRRPAHILHLLSKERHRFEEIVQKHPRVGPLGLIVGVPGIHGPGESVADISDVYMNADRVAKERQKLKRGPDRDGDDFFRAFAGFDEAHPGFVILATIGKVTVISLQSRFMRSQLLKDELLDGPINGIVNDAAHGWWRERNYLLMVSSIYCPVLHCWVPGLLSFTNGASADHFKYHFLAVFRSIAEEAAARHVDVTDEFFAGVMDFSEAERLGFIRGFVEFWSTRHDDRRTPDELRKKAEGLLRGCQEHFRAGVTRVSRINGVIPPNMTDDFVARAVGLLNLPSPAAFRDEAALLARDFPKLNDWVEWWIRPAHASMLFSSERTMDVEIWESIPATTNAEEAMHWKLYSACGRDHAPLEGLNSLWMFAEYYERQYTANLKGVPTHYGEKERWKMVGATTGHTKPSRAETSTSKRRKVNDGRPPDTKRVLLRQASQKKKSSNRTRQKKGNTGDGDVEEQLQSVLGPASYPWTSNSCWLDTSLQLLYMTVVRHFEEFSSVCQHLPSGSVFHAFSKALVSRHSLGPDARTSKALAAQRDTLRAVLKKAGLAKKRNEFEPLTSWLNDLLGKEITAISEASFLATSYFQLLVVDIHRCTGHTDIGGSHVEITDSPNRMAILNLGSSAWQQYKGNFSHYLADILAVERPAVSGPSCWRSKDGKPLCPGMREDVRNLVISIPISLRIEVQDDSRHDSNQPQQFWDFPATLTPHTKSTAKNHQLIYDLIGLGLVNHTGGHFIAQYVSEDKKSIYTYDGMKRRGFPALASHGKISTHLAGQDPQLPEGYKVLQVFYHLRGGLEAQKKFYELRSKMYQEKFNLKSSETSFGKPFAMSYTDEGMTRMEKVDRTWLAKPLLRNTSEYVSLQDARCSSDISMRSRDSPESEEETRGRKHITPPKQQSLPSSLTSVRESQASDSGSLPDSLFSLNCRCGLVGDGNILYQKIEGEAVQCADCQDWSHMACQKDGRASDLKDKEPFRCDLCLRVPTYARKSQRKEMESRTKMGRPLKERLRSGRGALARHGDYWYPVRLIQLEKDSKSWRVRWWRENIFELEGIVPDSFTVVRLEDLVDSLWLDHNERRKIRLGKWKHACDIETVEDILADPASIPYTKEVDAVLSPSTEVLKALLEAPDGSPAKIPARDWLKHTKQNPKTSIVPHVAGLSVLERARAANWFEKHISLHKKRRIEWVGRLPIAHAYTVFIASQLKLDPKYRGLDEDSLLEQAWKMQLTGASLSVWTDVDVDKGCLYRLEEEMFERSARAGKAGNYQWGLDAGDHQDCWDPYAGLPEQWTPGDRDGSETELQCGSQFITIMKPPPPAVETKPRPRPRPLRRKKKEPEN